MNRIEFSKYLLLSFTVLRCRWELVGGGTQKSSRGLPTPAGGFPLGILQLPSHPGGQNPSFHLHLTGVLLHACRTPTRDSHSIGVIKVAAAIQITLFIIITRSGVFVLSCFSRV